MNKLLSIGLIVASLIIGGCASSNSHFQLKKHFLTGFSYLYTDIPEPLEIDLSFLRNDFLYKQPTYIPNKNAAIFTYAKDGVEIIIKTLSPAFMNGEADYQPPQNVSDSAYIDYVIKYAIGRRYPGEKFEDVLYNQEKNYGYACITPKNSLMFNCEAVTVTPKRSTVAIEFHSKNETESKIMEWLIEAIESVKPVGN